MPEFQDDKKSVGLDLVASIVVVLYMIIIGIFTFYLLTGGNALENPVNEQKFRVFMILGFTAVLGMFVIKLENFLSVFFKLRRVFGKRIQAILNGLDCFIHQPRDSLLAELFGKKWWMNPFDLTLIWLIVGSIAGFFLVLTKTSLAQIFSFLFPQEISTIAELGFAVEPAVFSETMILMLIVGVVWGFFRYLLKKGIINKMTFHFITLGILPVLAGFFWMGIHTFVYGSYDLGLLVTWRWGWTQAVLGVLFCSVIPAYLLHFTNNIFTKSIELFATEITAIVVAVIIIILLAIFFIRVSIFARRKPE